MSDSQDEILSQETFDGLVSNLVRDGIDLNSIEASLCRSDSEWTITTQTATETVATVTIPGQHQVSHNPNNVPESTSFAGQYCFKLAFPTANLKHTKSMKWTYSTSLNKLFVQMNLPWPVSFITDSEPPLGTIVRGLVRFKEIEKANEPVKRCANHTLGDRNSGVSTTIVDHLMRSCNKMAGYHTMGVGHRSCYVGYYPHQDVGSTNFCHSETFTMACYSSCFGSLCRRPVVVIFSLERNGEVLGRQTVDIRICACPGRDLVNEESKSSPLNIIPTTVVVKQEAKEVDNNEELAIPCCSNSESPTSNHGNIDRKNDRKRKTDKQEPDENGMYCLYLKTRKRYKLFKKLNEGMNLVESSSSSSSLSTDSGSDDAELGATSVAQPTTTACPNSETATTTHFQYEDGRFTLRRTVTCPAVMNSNSFKSK